MPRSSHRFSRRQSRSLVCLSHESEEFAPRRESSITPVPCWTRHSIPRLRPAKRLTEVAISGHSSVEAYLVATSTFRCSLTANRRMRWPARRDSLEARARRARPNSARTRSVDRPAGRHQRDPAVRRCRRGSSRPRGASHGDASRWTASRRSRRDHGEPAYMAASGPWREDRRAVDVYGIGTILYRLRARSSRPTSIGSRPGQRWVARHRAARSRAVAA